MQKKDNAPNNQLKKNQKMEDKKGKSSAKEIVSRKVHPKEKEAIESPKRKAEDELTGFNEGRKA